MANPIFWVIIPARYASTRLPGKPLLDIGGKPMLQHVYERAGESGAARVLIATEDERIAQAARGFGADVCMTSAQHQSGTDRIAEVARLRGAAADSIIVNLQGDEPLMPPALVAQAAVALAEHPQADVATLCEPLHDRQAVFNPNIVKVVRDKHGFALYFSRAPIPWLREEFAQPAAYRPAHYRHIGLYAYRAGFLDAFTGLPPAPMEQDEALEQLRVLYHGGKIYVAEACEAPGPGVDTPDDLERARALLA